MSNRNVWFFSSRFLLAPALCIAVGLTASSANAQGWPFPDPVFATVADSAGDWSTDGTQGAGNWFNGYYDFTNDGDGTFAAEEFIPFLNDGSGSPSATNHWNGSSWQLKFDTNAPWTTIGQTDTHPNGTNSAGSGGPDEHWTVRRWVAADLTEATDLQVEWHARETNLGGAGVGSRLFRTRVVDGSPVTTEIDSALITRGDGTGITRAFNMSVEPFDVFDLALTPEDDNGVDRGDGSDGSANQLTIRDLSQPAAAPEWLTFWQAGQEGRGWPNDGGADGGGPNVDFVQEGGSSNPAPGDPNSPSVNQQADDDYYFAGDYPDPIGIVFDDEIAAERAFAGTDNDLRFHFNLPDILDPEDKFRFSLEPINLHDVGADTRYGVEVFFNGVRILDEVDITLADLNQVITTAEFTAADVGAIGGAGGDNVILVHGINFSAEGGGNWMGMDLHRLEVQPVPEPATFAMLLVGFLSLLPFLRRKRS